MKNWKKEKLEKERTMIKKNKKRKKKKKKKQKKQKKMKIAAEADEVKVIPLSSRQSGYAAAQGEFINLLEIHVHVIFN